MEKQKQYRQGDVFLRKLSVIPKGAEKQKRDGRIVLAYGEVTGHAHAIHEVDVDVYALKTGERYLLVGDLSRLVHEEHDTIELEPGIYEVIQQREYTPAGIVNVKD